MRRTFLSPILSIIKKQGPYILLLGLTALTCWGIVFQTRPCDHPDARYHLDGFTYFEQHWWPPDLNAEGLVYSPYGNSRVYSGEIVYFIYGRIIGLFRSIERAIFNSPPPVLSHPYSICRASGYAYATLNSIMFLITLGLLFFWRSYKTTLTILGFTLLMIPQVTYLSSYANSDAWGLFISILLFIYVYRQPDFWTLHPHKLMIPGILTGVIIASKQPFWFSLLYIYFLIAWDFSIVIKTCRPAMKRIAVNLFLVLCLALLVASPSRVVYPLTQGNFGKELEAMRENRAIPEMRPSSPDMQGLYKASKGESFANILMDGNWWLKSVKSFYGYFGYLTVPSPEVVYLCVLIILILSVVLTLVSLIIHWHSVPPRQKWLLIYSPAPVVIILMASLYHTWTGDYQPQGRYLFASLVPISLLMGGTFDFETRFFRIVRIAGWVVLYFINLYVLWFVVVINPELG